LKKEQAGQKLQRIIRRAGIAIVKDGRENKVKYGEHEKRLQYHPDIAEDASVITELEVGLGYAHDQFPVIFVAFGHKRIL